MVQGPVSHREDTDFVPSILAAVGFKHGAVFEKLLLAAGLRTQQAGPGPGRWVKCGCDPGDLA